MNKVLEDLNVLTTIPLTALQALKDKGIDCIAHSVLENVLSKNPLTELDIGIGILYIKLEDDSIKYRFIPSKKLEDTVASTILTKQSPVISRVETALKEKVESTYKNFL